MNALNKKNQETPSFESIRLHPRFSAKDVKIVFKQKHGIPTQGFVNDISEGGLHFSPDKPLNLETMEKLYMMVYLPQEIFDEKKNLIAKFSPEAHVTLIGEVRNAHSFNSTNGNPREGFGIKILVAMSDGEDILSQFLKILSKNYETAKIINEKEVAEKIVKELSDFNISMSLGSLLRKSNDKLIRVMS